MSGSEATAGLSAGVLILGDGLLARVRVLVRDGLLVGDAQPYFQDP